MTRGQKLTIFIVVILLVGGVAVWKVQSAAPGSAPTTSATSTSSVDEKTALAQLQADLQNVTPHFIVPTWQEGQTLTPEEQKIATDTAGFLSAQQYLAQPDQPPTSPEQILEFEIWLDTIGKRYILITFTGADETHDAILDSKTGQITDIPGVIPLYLPTKDVALNIGSQTIYEYSLDQASSTLVVGSQLNGTETYSDGIAQLGPPVVIQAATTSNSVTLSVFDSSKVVPNPDGGTMYTKVGQKTFSF